MFLSGRDVGAVSSNMEGSVQCASGSGYSLSLLANAGLFTLELVFFSEKSGNFPATWLYYPTYKPTRASVLLVDDDQIIASVRAGGIGEFRKLVERYQQPVYRFARNVIRDEHDAEDITQEVFLAAFDNLASYNANRSKFSTWLLTLTRNRCVNYLKRKRPVIDGEMIAGLHQITSTHESARNEFWRRLDEALHTLPIEQKTAFVLAEIEGLPYADIAQVERTTLGTVKSRIHRAKQRLRAAMTPTLGEKYDR